MDLLARNEDLLHPTITLTCKDTGLIVMAGFRSATHFVATATKLVVTTTRFVTDYKFLWIVAVYESVAFFYNL